MNSSTINATNSETNNNQTIDKRIKCPNCEKSFSNKSNLKTHITSIHKKIKDYVCPFDECSKKFSNNTRLKLHIKKHIPFSCSSCEKKFINNDLLKKHLKKHENHNNQEYKFKCPFCNDDFMNENELKMHKDSCSQNFNKLNF